MSTEPAGIPRYTIQRAYIGDTAVVNAHIAQQGELILNVGEVAMHMTPDIARRITAELTMARLIHDMKHEVKP